jgi:hypothetical protein
MKYFGAIVFVCLVSFFAAPQLAEAKDLSNRLGLGFKNQSSTELPGHRPPVLARCRSWTFCFSRDRHSNKQLEIWRHAKALSSDFFLRTILTSISAPVPEFLSIETAGNNESGFELMGFAGVEAFLAGLENVGFNFEFGTAITSISSGTRFRTLGDSPVRAGVTFYF